jgi:chromosome segregation protein
MRLKRLETYGFKSFADRLTFDFENGITAIIGHNGCGISNVVDSIMWVVGEQSAKALRGAEMADIIFNGCATRRPMPLAEVTLVLERDGIDAGDVAITRRLTRDGQSSYYLNGKPSRLKDIRELLMGTGIGTSAYSVIEQGRIGFILEASVKDRRAILEEAAGISRYKARRKVAGRKLEKVETDLERIGQVLGEVDKRLRTVRRQAEAALRHQELSTRLRDLRMVFALEEFGRLNTELTTKGERIDTLQGQEAEVAARLGELEAKLSEADVALVAMEEEIRTIEGTRSETRSARDVAGSQARDARNRLVEVDQQEGDDRKHLDEHGQRVAKVQGERNTTEAALKDADEGGDAELGRLYRERREQLDAMLAEIDGLIGQVEERKGREVECLRELSRIEAEGHSLASGKKGIQERRARLEEKRGGQESSLEEARVLETEAQSTVEKNLILAAEAHSKLDVLIRSREEAQAEGTRLESRLNDLRHEEGRAEVRLRLLSEYEKKLEGVFRGVKDVIQQMDRFPGICGIVADCFGCAKEYERAIETALGGRVQNIITETQGAAKDAIDFLKRERRGRATFLPLDDLRGRDRAPRNLLNEEGVIGVASELIEFDSKFRPAFEYLLGGTLICETLDHAINLRRRHRTSGFMLVTLDGDVINPGGAMTGGRQQGQDAGGLVSRKNEIRRLEEQLEQLHGDREKVAVQRDEAKKLAFDQAIAVEEHRKVIQAAERAAGEAKANLTKAERDRSHLEEFLSGFGTQLEELEQELSRIEADSKDLEGQNTWFTSLSERLDGELAQLQEKLHARGAERDRFQEEVNNLRVNMATTEERREALRNHIGHLDRQLAELDDLRQATERRLAGHATRREELTEQLTTNEAVHAEQAERFEQMSAKLNELIKSRDETRSGSEEERQEARALTTRQRGLERERQELELKAAEIKTRLAGISERILDDYEMDIAEAFENYERPDDLNLPDLRRELASTEQELSRLGPVNLAAIDELMEVEARQEFLARQFTDLSEAKEKLTSIIDQINDTSRKMFKKTYREVRGNFQDLFRKLYGGGKADLVLQVDEQNPDILEAGVEIIAQPPGKQPKSITLLSGGEKALTAIALLFAVYQTKPSPFCILDEVDAPLDESNTDVYCHMVKEFCTKSQFLVITHNKRTMQHADAIYGVTQQERGVSTKISVKLEDIDTSHDGEVEFATSVTGQGPFSN